MRIVMIDLRKPVFAVLAVAQCAVLVACADQEAVEVDYDRSIDFASYESFSWARDEVTSVTGELPITADKLAEIKAAIDESLKSKGYVGVSNIEESDFAVSFTVGTASTIEPHVVSGFFADNESRWRWGTEYFERGEVGTTGPRVSYRSSTTGELTVTIFDVEERRPVWRAAGSRELSKDELAGDAQTIANDVAELLRQFGRR